MACRVSGCNMVHVQFVDFEPPLVEAAATRNQSRCKDDHRTNTTSLLTRPFLLSADKTTLAIRSQPLAVSSRPCAFCSSVVTHDAPVPQCPVACEGAAVHTTPLDIRLLHRHSRQWSCLPFARVQSRDGVRLTLRQYESCDGAVSGLAIAASRQPSRSRGAHPVQGAGNREPHGRITTARRTSGGEQGQPCARRHTQTLTDTFDRTTVKRKRAIDRRNAQSRNREF
jgi:hypothetical protein